MVDQRFAVSVHIMTSLAYGQGLMTSEMLASSIRTNPTVVRRFVSKLVEAGLLESIRGKAGGVRLAKKPESITLRDIYKAVCDRPLIEVAEKEPQKNCVVSCQIGTLLKDITRGLEETSQKYLGQIRLSELIAKIND